MGRPDEGHPVSGWANAAPPWTKDAIASSRHQGPNGGSLIWRDGVAANGCQDSATLLQAGPARALTRAALRRAAEAFEGVGPALLQLLEGLATGRMHVRLIGDDCRGLPAWSSAFAGTQGALLEQRPDAEQVVARTGRPVAASGAVRSDRAGRPWSAPSGVTGSPWSWWSAGGPWRATARPRSRDVRGWVARVAWVAWGFTRPMRPERQTGRVAKVAPVAPPYRARPRDRRAAAGSRRKR